MVNQSKKNDPRMWKKWYVAGAVGGAAIKSPAEYANGDQRMLTVLTSNLTNDVIGEIIGNHWRFRHFSKKPNKYIKTILLGYAAVIANKIFSGETILPDGSPSWEKDVSNHVYNLLDYPEFKKQQLPTAAGVLLPILGNVRHGNDTLWGYSMATMANAIGCVAYLVKHGLDPQLLTQDTPEEATNSLLEKVQMLSEAMPGRVALVVVQ